MSHDTNLSWWDRMFHVTERQSTLSTEIIGGLATFMTMAYILAVNPNILGDAGMDRTAVMLATAIASASATVIMGLYANLPFALAPGMGLNAYFTYTVVLGMGYTWQLALFCVFIEGVIFIILSFTGVREALFNAIPKSLKLAISAGIGLFIMFIGFQNAGIVQDNGSTLVGMVRFREEFHTVGICALLTLIGTLIILIMYIRKIRGAILYGIIITWILGGICELVGIYQPNPDAGFYSVAPVLAGTDFTALGRTFGQCFKVDFSNVHLLDIVIIICSFLYVDIFDTIGTLIGGATKGEMLDENGELPEIKEALVSDAVGTTAGAILGTSTVTTFVESSAGIAAGARTGLSSLVTAGLFLVATFAASIFTSIPSFATAPALLVVGILMIISVGKITWGEHNLAVCAPAVFCIFGMAFFYSIAEGIAWGVISYTVLHIFCGGNKEDGFRMNWLMYVLTIVFICKYIFL